MGYYAYKSMQLGSSSLNEISLLEKKIGPQKLIKIFRVKKNDNGAKKNFGRQLIETKNHIQGFLLLLKNVFQVTMNH